MALDTFIKTYSDRVYSYTTTVRHQGTVLAFALSEEAATSGQPARPQISYAMLDLAGQSTSGNTSASSQGASDSSPSELDVDAWSAAPQLVPFPTEIAQVGYGIADQTELPVFKTGSVTAAKNRSSVTAKERDDFASTTARLTVNAPFQVLSDGKHIYLFRQAIGAADANMVFVNPKGEIQLTAGTAEAVAAPIVDSTLLVDRFVLSGDKLLNTQEVRFQRSRSKTRAQSEKDSLAAKDLDGTPFIEPTQEMVFVNRLRQGRFAVIIVPTQVVEIERWHIMAHNSQTGRIDAYSVERAADGLFNTRGTQFYTSPDPQHQRDVFEAKPGKDPATGKDLIPVVSTQGFSGTAVAFGGTGGYLSFANGIMLGAAFTFETWIRPTTGQDVQLIVGNRNGLTAHSNGNVDGTASTAPSVWLKSQTRIGVGLGDGTSWHGFTTKSLLSPNQWAHVAVTLDQGALRVYVNGRLREKFMFTPAVTPTLTAIDVISSPEHPLSASVDEIRLWTRSRQANELLAEQHRRLVGREPGLIAYLRFDEATGTTAHDHTDNRYDGQLQGTTWATSDAPVGQGSGLQRNSFEIATSPAGTASTTPAIRTVESGLTAVLYHQQASVVSGYDQQQKPLKQNARVLLAFATAEPEATQHHIAALDFAVSRAGELTQMPNVVALERLDTSDAQGVSINDRLDNLSTVQRAIQGLDETIVDLDTAIADLVAVETIVNDAIANPTTSTAGAVAAGPWNYLNTHVSAWLGEDQTNLTNRRAHQTLVKNHGDTAKVEFHEHANHIGKVYLAGAGTVDQPALEAVELDNQISSVRFPAPPASGVPGALAATLYSDANTAGASLALADDVDVGLLNQSVKINGSDTTWNDITSSLVVGVRQEFTTYQGTVAGDITALEQKLKPHKDALTTAQTQITDQLKTLRQSKTDSEQRRQTEQAKIANLREVLVTGPPAVMKMVHTDVAGLTLSGSILGFAWTIDAPRLFDSAMGKLAMYFRGSSDQFFVSYYNTSTQRAQYRLAQADGSDTVTCVARAADLDMDQIVITVAGSGPTCALTIAGPAFTETWQNVPRAPAEFSKVLNGQAGDRTPLGRATMDVTGSTVTLSGTTKLIQAVTAGTTLMLGDTRLVVRQDAAVGATSIAVTVGAGPAPTGTLPLFLLIYDYTTHAKTDRIPNDLYNGSLLVTASPALVAGSNTPSVSPVVNQVVTSGATLSSRWTAEAPGSTVFFDGKRSHLEPAANHDLERFASDDDVTLETWLQPRPAGTDEATTARLIDYLRADPAPATTKSSYTMGLTHFTALVFNGTDQYVDLGTDVNPGDGSWTMELWFRCDNVTGQRILYNKESHYEAGVLDGNFQYALKYQEGPEWNWRGGNKFPVIAGEWYHATVVFDQTANKERVYRNGALVWEEDATSGGTARALGASAKKLLFGARGDTSPMSYFQGAIGEVRAWSSARTASDIALSFRRRAGSTETPKAGDWRLGAEQQRVVDVSPLGRHGTIQGSPSALGFSLPFVGINDTWIESDQVVEAGRWSHLAASYVRSFGVELTAGGHLDAGNKVALDIDKDLTIDLTIVSKASNQWQGLVARGALDDGEDDDVPYMLAISPSGHLVFGFEDEAHANHSFTSSSTVTANTSQRVTVTREQKTFTTTVTDTEIYTFSWYEIAFFINAAAAGTGTYEAKAAARTQAQTMGSDARSQSDANKVILRTLIHGLPTTTTSTTIKPTGIGHHAKGTFTLGRGYRDGSATAIGFVGTITKADIWNVARAQTDLDSNATDGLAARWRFKERTGTKTLDEAGDNHASLIGNVTWVDDPDPKNSKITFYHNGTSFETQFMTEAARTNLATSTNQFTIGAHRTGASTVTQHYQGELEETRIWKVPRTKEQIQDNLFRRLTGEEEQLMAYYTYDVESSSQSRPTTIGDGSYRANRLEVRNASFVLSMAPIGEDTPQVRSALAGVKTDFHGTVSSSPAIAEYADLQYDSSGAMSGAFKRLYSITNNKQWQLITGFKVGDLLTEWIGQVQFDPQLIGYIEGAPPVPSENLAATGYVLGEFEDYVGGATVELTQADESVHTYSASKDTGADLDVSFKLGFVLGAKINAGLGITKEMTDIENVLGLAGQFEASWSWLDESSAAAGRETTQTTAMQLKGSVENVDAIAHPAVGRRFVPDNVGMALVLSETADVFALRLKHNNALISFQMRPNPDIPPDRNIITFPINPRYTKQGVLDGKVGLEPDPNYPNALTYSSNISYFKPLEAYGWKKEIERETAALATYYGSYDASLKGREAPAAGSGIDSGLISGWPTARKRNLANTYVWTSDGGMFAEEEAALDELNEMIGGSYEFKGMGGVYADLTAKFSGVGVKFELDALGGGHLNRTVTKAADATTGFGLVVDLGGVEGDVYLRDTSGALVMDTTDARNPKPRRQPGRVDAYRFMSFFHEPKADHFDTFFNQVVDPIWLDQSTSANAAALRQARQDDKRPPCWRIVHRVTFVSRVLPEIGDAPAGSLEQSLRELEIDSNYELIRQLEPLVAHRATSPADLSTAVAEAVRSQLPELISHTEVINQYMADYLGLAGPASTDPQGFGEGSLVDRVVNQPPIVDAGNDQIVGLDGTSLNVELEATAFDDRFNSVTQLYTNWDLLPESSHAADNHTPTITDRLVPKTMVKFTDRGRYGFNFRGSDGDLSAQDQVHITVNERPVAAATERVFVNLVDGAVLLATLTPNSADHTWLSSQLITTPPPAGALRLDGRVVDTGLGDPQRGSVTITWSDERNTNQLRFQNPSSATTLVTFQDAGYYRLRLLVDNGTFSHSVQVGVAVATRATNGLQALYSFEEGTGTTVGDVSGVIPALDLQLAHADAVSWTAGGLTLNRPTLLSSTGPAADFIQAVTASGEITVEAWVAPTTLDHDGLGRIVTLSAGAAARNLMLGQQNQLFHGAMRTTATTLNAADQALAGGPVAPGALTHVVYTRDRTGQAALAINGTVVEQRRVSGEVTNWDDQFELALGHEADFSGRGSTAWLGTFHLVALYSRALSSNEIDQNYKFGADKNLPPVIEAGPARTINSETLPTSTQLVPELVVHDRPTPGEKVTWLPVSGPSGVTIELGQTPPLATFSEKGRFVLRLTVDDQELSVSDDLTVTVNTAPRIDAGSPRDISLPGSLQLTGRVIDNGRGDATPPPVQVTWILVSGPSDVVIAQPDQLTTAIELDPEQNGEYRFQLSVSNSVFTSTATAQVFTHTAPVISASLEPLVTMASSGETTTALTGQIDNDGRGNPTGTVTSTWTQISGPAGVQFTPDATILSPTAQFPSNGIYTLQIEVNNGHLTTRQQVSIVVNEPPVVSAGPFALAVVDEPFALDGTVADDGLPLSPGRVSVAWDLVDGPGEVTFDDPDRDYTFTTFSAAGTYRLAFEADDGAVTTSNETTVVVTATPVVTAGSDQLISEQSGGGPTAATLTGTLDAAALTGAAIERQRWLPLTGSGADLLASPDQLSSAVQLNGTGTHRFRLTAWVRVEGIAESLVVSDEVSLTVGSRVMDGLELLYTFDNPIRDGLGGERIVGVGPSATDFDLHVEDPSAVVWHPSGTRGVSIESPTLIASSTAATSLNQALRAGNGLTLETWVTPRDLTLLESEPARIVTISLNAHERNLTLGQTRSGRYDVRIRTSDTNNNGLGVTIGGGEVIVDDPIHIVLTWSGASETAVIYLNGSVEAEVELDGVLNEAESGWDLSYRLGLGDEINGSRAWRGTYHLLAFYRRALSAEEVRANYASSDRPPDGPSLT